MQRGWRAWVSRWVQADPRWNLKAATSWLSDGVLPFHADRSPADSGAREKSETMSVKTMLVGGLGNITKCSQMSAAIIVSIIASNRWELLFGEPP